MAAGDRTAIFRAIGDFSRLVRESRKAKKDMGSLGDQTKKTGQDIDDTGKKSDRTSTRMGRLAAGAKKVHAGLSKVQSSGFGKWLDRTDTKTRGLLKTLAGLAVKAAALGLVGTFATASLGPVLGLVGAVVSLSGAVGVLPGLLVAVKSAAAVLKVAFLGVEDAFKAMSKPGAEFQEAIKDMPPSMQRAMWEMRRMKSSVDNLRKGIQQKFWEGLSKPIRDLGNVWFPILRRRGRELAGTFNHMAKEAASFFTNRSNADDLSHSLGNVNKFWDQMVGAVKPLLGVLRDVFAVSSELLPGMSKGAKGAAQRFAEMVHKARETGKLKTWIQNGIDAVKDLFGVLKNVGRILGAVFKAGKAEGAGFLETLKKITDKFADFLESDKGQDNLRKLFRAIGDAADIAMPIVKALFDVLAQILPVLVKIGEKVGPGVEKLIRGIGEAVKAAEPGVLRLGEAIGDLLGALGDAGPMIGALVSGLADALTPVVKALTWLVRTLTAAWNAMPKSMQDVVSGIGGWVIAIGLAAIALAKLIKLGKSAVGVVGTIAGALNKLPGVNLPTPGKTPPAAAPAATPGTATVPVPDAGKDAEKKGKGAARRFLSALGRGIKSGASGIATAVSFLFGGAAKGVTKSAGGIAKAFAWATPKLAGVLRLVGAGIMFLATAFRTLGIALLTNPIVLIITAIAAIAFLIITNWSTVKGWIAGFFSWLGSAASAVWSWLTSIFTAALTWIQNLWHTVWGAIAAFFTMIWNGIKAAALAVWNGIRAAASAVWNGIKNVLTSVLNGIRNVWNSVWGAIRGAALAVWNGIRNVISSAINGVRNVVSSVLNGIRNVWNSVWGGIKNFVGGIWDGITGIISGAIGGIRDFIGGFVDFFKGVWETIKSIVSSIGDAVSWVGDRISDVAGAVNPANWFGQGGLVGGETGHKPVMAEQGEYIVPKGAARKWLPWLRAINPYDRGNLQADMSGMLANVATAAPTFGTVVSSGGTGYTAGAGEAGGIRDVHVTQIVNNPLPEKPSESASRRVGRAAKLGVASALGGVA